MSTTSTTARRPPANADDTTALAREAFYRRFVEAWYTSQTFADVCRVLGMDRRVCSNVAAAMRKRGVPLPKHARSGHEHQRHCNYRIGWAALARWAEACRAAAAMKRYRQGA